MRQGRKEGGKEGGSVELEVGKVYRLVPTEAPEEFDVISGTYVGPPPPSLPPPQSLPPTPPSEGRREEGREGREGAGEEVVVVDKEKKGRRGKGKKR